MTFTPKNWQNAPSTSTPLSAAALVDLETRLSGYTDSRAGSGSVAVSSTNGTMTVNGGVGTEWWVPAPTNTGSVDTANISAVITAVNTAGGGAVRFPPGIYQITSALPSITVPVHLKGATSGINDNSNGGIGNTKLVFTAGIPGLVFANNGSSSNPQGLIVEDLYLYSGDFAAHGYGTINTDHGINISGAYTHASTFRKLQIYGFGGDGIHQDSGYGSSNSIGSRYEQIRIVDCSGNGIYINGQNSSVTTLDTCDISSVGLWAYYLIVPGCVVLNCQTEYASQNAGRTVTNGTISGGNSLTSSTANFVSTDVGCVVTGTGIPSNTSITAVNSTTNVTLSKTCTNGSSLSVTILAGGALRDNSMGNNYINFYAEGGLGSNCAFDPSGNVWTTWISGGWTSAWFSAQNPWFCIDPSNTVIIPPVTSNGSFNVQKAGNQIAVDAGDNGLYFYPNGGTNTILSGNGQWYGTDYSLKTAGKGLRVTEGSNCKQGTATLSAGTVTVANTSVTATSRIFLTAQDNSTTGVLRVSARTAGTSFTITSSNSGDSGVVAYQIFEPA